MADANHKSQLPDGWDAPLANPFRFTKCSLLIDHKFSYNWDGMHL